MVQRRVALVTSQSKYGSTEWCFECIHLPKDFELVQTQASAMSTALSTP